MPYVNREAKTTVHGVTRGNSMLGKRSTATLAIYRTSLRGSACAPDYETDGAKGNCVLTGYMRSRWRPHAG